jgi:putative ABC transport system substrate-binding protein
LGKQLELLDESISGLRQIAILRNPTNPAHRVAYEQIDGAAVHMKIKIHAVDAHDAATLAHAYSTISALKPQALLVLADVVFDGRLPEIAEFARTSRLPAIYNKSAFAEAGGFMSYGARYEEFFRQAARYVDRILHGAAPSDLPVVLPTKFDLVVNRKTARELAIGIPQSVLLRADRVID